MLTRLTTTLLATTLAASAFAATPTTPATPKPIAYAIDNPLRPGAKAAPCPAQAQVIDGCTFHSVAGEAYAARLPVEAGETWTAVASDGQSVRLERADPAHAENGTAYQVIRVLPNPAVNADATVTFDRLSGQPGALKVIERRRITVMIHPS